MFYYLQSRHYDPMTGRFINADDTSILQMTQGELLGGNLYTYCGNNGVMNVDPNGSSITVAIPAIGVGLILLALLTGYLIYYYSITPRCKLTGFDFKKWLVSKTPVAILIPLSVYTYLINYAKQSKQNWDNWYNKPSQILGRNMRNAGMKPPKKPGNYHAHHIVPFAATAFKSIADILTLKGIDLNSYFNGVWLEASYHCTLMTKKYFDLLTSHINIRMTKEQIIQALNEIRRLLENGWSPK